MRSQLVIQDFSISFNPAQQRLVVCLKVNDRHSAEEVAAAEYRLALGLLSLSQLAAARLLGISGRRSRRFACAEHAVPEKVMARLWSWVWFIMQLPDED
jgi:flavin reductase (DIM6/NTAB) family NADH-FMN oxidoreductase RutF